MTVVLGRVDGTAGSPAPHSTGDRWRVIGVLTFTGNYTTGGDALDLGLLIASVGAGIVDKVNLDDIAGFRLTYDYVNKKIQTWYVTSATTSPLTEIPGAPTAYPAALLTAATARAEIIGR